MKKIARDIFKIIFVVIFLLVAKNAEAASLYFYPNSGTFNSGATFSVQVLVNTSNEAVNAYSGDVSYPSDKLTLLSVSKSGSIVNFWSSEPSGSKGVAHFEGITVDPGYKGTAGKIVTLTFKAISEGSALVKFSSSSVLANDGLGTNVLTSSGVATYTITGEKKVIAPITIPEPVISSETHPDQESWYNLRVAKISWELPSGITDVSYTTNANPNGLPYAFFGLAKGRSTPLLSDGVWYTHVRFKGAGGIGQVAHFKTQIDGTAPIKITANPITTSESVNDSFKIIKLESEDALSGIARFGILVNGGEEKFVEATNNQAEFKTEKFKRGTYQFVARAYDRAGNSVETNGEFEITHIEAPIISEYPETLRHEDFLIIRGTAEPDSKVLFSMIRQVEKDGSLLGAKQYTTVGEPFTGETVADHSGHFIFAYEERLQYGMYRIRARVSSGGIESESSPEVVVNVIEGLWMKVVHIIMIPTVTIGILCLLGLIFIIFFIRLYKKYHSLRNNDMVREVERIRV